MVAKVKTKFSHSLNYVSQGNIQRKLLKFFTPPGKHVYYEDQILNFREQRS